MDIWTWLSSPIGTEFQHALIGLILAVTAYVSYRTHEQSKANSAKLDNHIDQHVLDVVSKDAAGHNM